jgi:ABC-type branched-subunit amino acid transport system ATPase component
VNAHVDIQPDTSTKRSEATAGLVAEGVTMRFGGNTALNDVALTLPRGEWTGLIGPNGSGKTTMLNVLSGIYVPHAGRTTLDGEDIGSLRPGPRSRLGVVRTFQHPQLAESLTMWENVLLGVDLRRSRERRGRVASTEDPVAVARKVVDIFGFTEYAEHVPSQAPYGVRKIAEIARAVVASPKVLLLDEPAAGLSREERRELIGALTVIRDARPDMAVCLVEHDIRLVASVCPTIQVLNFGKVLASGTSSQVLKDQSVIEAYLGKSAARLNEGNAS